ncbi:MAG: hypothetical protein IT454_21280 [Planctomycetes bacterium]|nr:hypothetical protein [Planctomycetota bacterium]
MVTTLRAAVLCALAAFVAALPQSKKPGAPKVVVTPFSGSYEEALQRAVDRNVPLVLVGIAESDTEALDQDITEFRAALFTRAEFVAASPLLVLALGANRAHELTTLEIERGNGLKDTVQVCSVYRTEGCVAHQKMFDALYREHNVDGELRSPAVIVIGPDRKPAKSWQTGHSPEWSELLSALKDAQTKAGEGLTEAQLADVRALLARGTREYEQRQFGASYASWGKVLGITSKTRYSDQARKEQARCVAELDQARAEARAWLAEARAVEAWTRLGELTATWAGTPFEKELARELAALEKDKSAKDAIAAHKRELEAERLWSEARDLETAKEAKKAEAKVRQLIRKFGDTKAGRRARESYPQWAAEEDQKKGG